MKKKRKIALAKTKITFITTTKVYDLVIWLEWNKWILKIRDGVSKWKMQLKNLPVIWRLLTYSSVLICHSQRTKLPKRKKTLSSSKAWHNIVIHFHLNTSALCKSVSKAFAANNGRYINLKNTEKQLVLFQGFIAF